MVAKKKITESRDSTFFTGKSDAIKHGVVTTDTKPIGRFSEDFENLVFKHLLLRTMDSCVMDSDDVSTSQDEKKDEVGDETFQDLGEIDQFALILLYFL